ncbi:DUF3598 family protein [Oscillatoria sp. FACHB-1407]|uniref:DUF3598 family protein n=1 Tax=Oscillatoria sp. FACHB-1407 TaxID=2692847 RepID=UPI001688C02A|nr:DUF3598 family protein [Oscillatoria sp. FACHB-1407]MBD2465625.1 DUF3598 family protein [Oscillatoria sp. FACHB-1407]
MTNSGTSQWDNLLRNLGAWEGSFTRLSPQGQVIENIPTIVTLAGIDNNQTVRQTLQYYSPITQELTQEKVLEYSSLGRGVLVFEDGAFSQGSLQFSPVAEFGAELGFIWKDRRMRLVELFDSGELSSLTLIREQLQGSSTAERPPLTVQQLVGTWQGEAVTLHPDWRPPDRFLTTLAISQEGDYLHQQLTTPHFQLSSSARISDSRLLFDQGIYPSQVVLLPDGASANTPLSIPRGRPFLLEAGWMMSDRRRQRMIRSYDAKGAWSSLTLVTEQKEG